jgi:drug/metabolite transporter (DMT)-like permease
MRPEGNAQFHGLGAMVGATLLWGATFVVIRDSLRAIDPLTLVFVRFVAASVVLLAFAATRWRSFTRATLVGGALAGLCFAGGFLFQAIGLTRASAGSSAFLTCAGTLFAAFYAWPLLGQRPSAVLLQGLLLALSGSALLSMAAPEPWRFRFGVGESWTLAGAAMFGLQIVALARTAPRADGLVLATVQALTVAVVLLPFAGGATARFAALAPADRWRLAYLVGAGSVIAPLLQIRAQRLLPAGRVALLFALEPVFALAFALTLGGERFSLGWWLGAALILTGVVRVEGNAVGRGPRGLAEAPRAATSRPAN